MKLKEFLMIQISEIFDGLRPLDSIQPVHRVLLVVVVVAAAILIGYASSSIWQWRSILDVPSGIGIMRFSTSWRTLRTLCFLSWLRST